MLTLLPFLGVTVLAFAATEAVSYLLHRFVFHGPLWRIHQTHHRPKGRGVELNDVFSLGFAALAVGLYWRGPFGLSPGFAVATGITLYGLFFFVVHDGFVHRRWLRVRSRNRYLLALRAAHHHHHRSATRQGQEPYGLLWFRHPKVPPSVG
jgi:beta-carotene 3-hydroxylase